MILDYPFTMEDMQRANEDWGANCGPAALAFALQMHIESVHPLIPEFPQKRYTSPGMMRAALANFRQPFIDVRPPSKELLCAFRLALVRIQWTGPWTAPGANPRWAYRHTHWIATWRNDEGEERVFDCNGGIRDFDSWQSIIVPLITGAISRADGQWMPTHIWRLEPKGGAK